MKEGWEKKKLGEVAEIIGGSTPKTNVQEYWGGTNYWVTPAELSGEKYIEKTERTITDLAVKKTNLQLLPPGTVLLSSRAPIGKTAITTVPMYCNQGFKNIVCSESLCNSFVYWYLSYNKDFLNELGTGATFKEISKKTVSNIEIPVPPLSVQESIVSELDMLSGIISKHKALQEEYDRLEQSIFYDMFGDPVTNEKGWEVKKLGDECTEVKYGTSRPASEDGQYKYLRMGNLTQNGFLDLTDVKTIDIPDDEIEKCIVRKGDVLFNRTNSLELIGKTCLFDLDEPMVIAGYIIRVRLTERINQRYLVSMFNLPSIKTLLKSMAKGAVNQANINSQELKSIKVPLPPIENQNEYEKKFDFIEQMKAKNKAAQEEAEMLFNERMAYYF